MLDLNKDKISILYRHMYYAEHFKKLTENSPPIDIEKHKEILNNLEGDLKLYTEQTIRITSELWINMSFWYSSLYAVIEGLKDFKLSTDKIDALLKPNYVDALRLFRNALMHPQEEYFSEKTYTAISIPDFGPWISNVHYTLKFHIDCKMYECP
jgi:hypothetical protein